MTLPADMSKVLFLAVKKCEQDHHLKQWAAALTPAEILALDKAGVRLAKRDVEIAIENKRAGRNFRLWIYFDYKDKVMAKLKERLS